jgi:hypothetical protein
MIMTPIIKFHIPIASKCSRPEEWFWGHEYQQPEEILLLHPNALAGLKENGRQWLEYDRGTNHLWPLSVQVDDGEVKRFGFRTD